MQLNQWQKLHWRIVVVLETAAPAAGAVISTEVETTVTETAADVVDFNRVVASAVSA